MTDRALPMGDMNMTPLIDVLLVLLVMMLVTIPVATHSVDIDLPAPCFDCPQPPLSSVRNRVHIDAQDHVLWNGERVTPRALAGAPAQTRRMAVEPELQFDPHPRASYDASARTLRVIEASGVGNFGFVGNERFRTFGR